MQDRATQLILQNLNNVREANAQIPILTRGAQSQLSKVGLKNQQGGFRNNSLFNPKGGGFNPLAAQENRSTVLTTTNTAATSALLKQEKQMGLKTRYQSHFDQSQGTNPSTSAYKTVDVTEKQESKHPVEYLSTNEGLMRKIDSRPNPTAGNLLSDYMLGKINGGFRPYKGTKLEGVMMGSPGEVSPPSQNIQLPQIRGMAGTSLGATGLMASERISQNSPFSGSQIIHQQEAGRNTALSKLPINMAHTTLNYQSSTNEYHEKLNKGESRKDWTDAVKLDLTKQNDQQDKLQVHRLDFSRFQKAQLVGGPNALSRTRDYLSPGGYGTPFANKNLPRGLTLSNTIDLSGGLDSGHMRRFQTEILSKDASQLESTLLMRKRYYVNATLQSPQPHPQPFEIHIDVGHRDVFSKQSPQELSAQSRMTVHQHLKQDILEDNKVEEFEKIVLKKLLMDQQSNQMLQMQALSSTKKIKFNKKKLSPANENMRALQDPQESRYRKAEFKREKMMTSVNQLLGIGGNDSQYSMLIQGIAGTQIVPNLAPAPLSLNTTAVLRPSIQKPPKDPSLKAKQQFGYRNFEQEQLEQMRKVLLEQSNVDTSDILEIKKGREVSIFEQRTIEAFKQDMSTIMEETDPVQASQMHHDTIFDVRINRQAEQFASTIEDIIKENLQQKEKKELEEKRAKYPNHPMFKKKEPKVPVLEKLDQLLEDVEEKQEEEVEPDLQGIAAEFDPAPIIKKQIFIKKRENFDTKAVPAISMIQGGISAVAKGKNQFIQNQKNKIEQKNKFRRTAMISQLQLPKSELLVGGNSDSAILQLLPAALEGDTSIFQQTQIECQSVSPEDEQSSSEQTERNFLEEFKRYKESLITVEIGGATSVERATDDGGQTRNLMASSQQTSCGYSESNLTIYEQGEIANMKRDFMQNLKKMQRDLGISGQFSQLGFQKEELSQLVSALIDFHLQEALAKLEETKGHISHDTSRSTISHDTQNPTKGLEYYHKNAYLTFEKVGKDIQDALQQAQMNKNAFYPELLDRLQDDYKFRYFYQCRERKVGVLPLMQKIKNNLLNLTNYGLSGESIRAFADTIRKKDTFLTRVALENNGLKDEDFASLLEGLGRLLDIKSLIYVKNEFLMKSVQQIEPILTFRSIPYHLEELRLVNCKISQNALSALVNILHSRNYLKRLGLVNLGMTEGILKQLTPFIQNSRYLIELDLSWNGFRAIKIADFIDAIGENKQLQYFNFSWNNLVPNSDMSVLRGGPQNILKSEADMVELLQAAINKYKTLKPNDSMSPEEIQYFIMAKFTKMIKYNKNLLHLDLSSTGLTEQMLRTIGASLNRSKSVLALHLSGNPGVTPALKDFLYKRIRCCKPKPDIFQELPKDQDYDPSNISPSKVAFDRVVGFNLQKNFPIDQAVRDGIEASQVIKQKKISNLNCEGLDRNRTCNELTTDDDKKLIFQRWVGHKIDIPGSGQWHMLTDKQDQCWVCDKWIYSIVFWNNQIGQSVQVDIDFEEKAQILDQIRLVNERNPLLDSDEHKISPLIVGSFTNWMWKKMFNLDQFLRSVDKIQIEDLIKQLKNKGIIRYEVKVEEDLNLEEKHFFKKHANTYYQHRRKHWLHSLARSLKYNKKPHLANAQIIPKSSAPPSPRDQQQINQRNRSASSSSDGEEGDGHNTNQSHESPNQFDLAYGKTTNRVTQRLSKRFQEDIWVLPVFMRAGKHSYFVKAEGEHFSHALIAPYRDEEIPIQVKTSKTKIVERKFKKEMSVFKDWREDSPYILQKSAEIDKREWKAPRFIKDPDEVDKCWDVIWKYFARLKDIFITMASRSNFPSVTLLDFTTFSDMCKIMDKNVNLSTIDRLFIATNVEIIANDENPDKELCRFEFFEILLRLGNVKYRETGISNSYHQALEKIIKENVLAYYKPYPWQEFRDRELWSVEVNDVFEANMEGLKKFYAFFFDPRKKFMSMQDAIDMMIKLTPLLMTEKDAYFCYGMCKMTCVNEAEESTQRYKRMQFVELFELIGRIAEVKFRGTEFETSMNLAQRIEFVLDDIFTLVDVRRRDVNIIIDEQSESDDEY